MPLQALASSEPIPGYIVRKRIGAGGYGEVWTAEVPGGLTKAIKFVYGYLDEDRASRELKALNRIKEVRHPFLLSLERIEVVDGQLLIVTELAEASLKDRFDDCLQAGLPGIEREELLGYMRDTAEVLDFMNGRHSLQHLDIKPENLLLLAGRVKVADFGLVKHITDATLSLMGGLTPLYAPPEVFDGRPSRFSDQYSLAIVFQEMLTGELPFPGSTAVELARLHLSAEPKLDRLPEADRPIIQRALAKRPNDRFNNCLELVEALMRGEVRESPEAGSDAPVDGAESMRQTYPPRGSSPPRSTTIIREISPRSERASLHGMPRIEQQPESEVLPPLDLPDTAIQPRPTLFVGVGRTAGIVLRDIKRQMHDRVGPPEEIPCWRLLLLDTDSRDIMHATTGPAERRLGPEEVEPVPLRRPKEYRDDSRQLLKWISRRWLYNIPRSLRTEGLRPLGRLAFVDHCDKLRARISDILSDMNSAEAREQSSQATTWNFLDAPLQVVVISSIAGGTGSGMVLDLAYLAREEMMKARQTEGRVMGMLLHSTDRSPRARELALVNSYACLEELEHFSRGSGDYPGDPCCDLAPRYGQGGPFDETYLVQLGDEISEPDLNASAAQVAEYLVLEGTTPFGQFTRRSREPDPDSETEAFHRLRTFGLHAWTCLTRDSIQQGTSLLCEALLEAWIHGGRSKRDQQTRRDPAAMDQLFGLDVPALAGAAVSVVEHQLGQSLDAFLEQAVAPFQDERKLLGDRHPVSWMSELFEKAVHGENENGGLRNQLEAFREEEAEQKSQQVAAWVLKHVDRRGDGVRGAAEAAQLLKARIQAHEEDLKRRRIAARQWTSEREAVADAEAAGRGRRPAADPRQAVEESKQYFLRRLEDVCLEEMAELYRGLDVVVSDLQHELLELNRELRHIEKLLGSSDDELLGEQTQRILDRLQARVPELVVQLDQRLRGQLDDRKDLHELFATTDSRTSGADRIRERIRSESRTIVVQALKQIPAADLILGADEKAAESEVSAAMELARPALLNCGGASRAGAMVADPETSNRIAAAARTDREHFQTVPAQDGSVIFFYEVANLMPSQVAVTLVEKRVDLVQCASRLHTRTDVKWHPLPDVPD